MAMNQMEARGAAREPESSRPSLAHAARRRRADHAAPNRARVLVAGDCRDHRQELVRTLGRAGFEVVEFAEWLQLVAFLRRLPLFELLGDPADIVLLDLRMSGRPLLDRVVAVTEDRLPIVLVTAAGADVSARDNWHVLAEPFGPEALRQAVLEGSLARGGTSEGLR